MAENDVPSADPAARATGGPSSPPERGPTHPTIARALLAGPKPDTDPRLLGRVRITAPKFAYQCLVCVAFLVWALAARPQEMRTTGPYLLLIGAVLGDAAASFAAARDVGRGAVSRAMYAWDWAALGSASVGAVAGAVYLPPDTAVHAAHPAITGLFAIVMAVRGFRRAARRRRLASLPGVERVFD